MARFQPNAPKSASNPYGTTRVRGGIGQDRLKYGSSILAESKGLVVGGGETQAVVKDVVAEGKTGVYNPRTSVFISDSGEKFSISASKVFKKPSEIISSQNKGGYFVTPYGGQVSSKKTEAELNKDLKNASIGGIDYFAGKGKSGFEPVVSKGKDFVGRYVQVGVVDETQKVVGQRARDVISQSQISYTKSYLQSLAGQKKVIVKEPVVKDETFKAPTWQNVVRKGDYVGGGLTLLGESADLISFTGEKVKGFATKEMGYVPETGLNVFNPLTFPQRGVYLAGSFGKGLGEGYKFFGSVPGLVGAGVGAAPIIFGEFVSKPIESGFKYGGLSAGFIGGSLTSFGESFVTDPVSFAGEYAGGYAAFGVGAKGIGLAVKPVNSLIGKGSSFVTPKVKFGEIASKRVEGYYKKGDLKALQFSDVGVKNVEELIAYPKSSQAAKYFAKTNGTKLGKGEGVVVRVMTARTEGYIGRLLGKKELVVGSKGAYTDYEIGSLFSAGVEPTGFPIKGLASGKTAYEFSILPKAPKFYDPNILLIKTGIGRVKGTNSVKLLKQFGYDLSKSPTILEQNISKVGAGKRVLQVRQIKGLTQKELNKELQKMLVKPSLKTTKAYPTTSELIGTQTEAEFTFIRGTNLEKVGLKTLGQRVTGRTATTQFPTGGGKSLLTDVELYANVSKASSKSLTAYEKSVLKDISQAAKEGYSVKRYVSPFDVTSVGSASLVSRGVGKGKDFGEYYSKQKVVPEKIYYNFTPSYEKQNLQVIDVKQYVSKIDRGSQGGGKSKQNIKFVQDFRPVAEKRINYGRENRIFRKQVSQFSKPVSRFDYYKYLPTSFSVPKSYSKKSDDFVFKERRVKREVKVKGISVEYSSKGVKNIILPIRTDWLKALKYYEKKPSVSTIELLPSKAKGSRQIAGLLGFKF